MLLITPISPNFKGLKCSVFGCFRALQSRNIYGIIKTDEPRTLDFSGVFLIYANNGSKSALARDLGDCRDNKGKLAKRVFICLTGNFLLSKRARCANEMHLWKKKIGAGDRARREEKAVR